jgi:cystatin-A/B
MMKCGGVSAPKPMNPEMFSKFVSLKANIQAKAGLTFTVFEPVAYTSQVVAGTNYKAKIKVDGGKYIHVKLFEPLPCYDQPIDISEVLQNKTEADAL